MTATMLLHIAQCISRWCLCYMYLVQKIQRFQEELDILCPCITQLADVYAQNVFNKDQNHQMFGSLVVNEWFDISNAVS